ncbi:MAG TPA: hypothetical protein VJ792_01230 [Candidatus Nitrosotalea sp.]|nr:hypothetical protein [Candidatus Nitrosotalea sp.]
MEEVPNDVIVLSAIEQGSKKLDKIKKKTGLQKEELEELLARLEKNSLVTTVEKKGFFGPKKEIVLTERGLKELEARRFELQQNWDRMVTLWKGGDKEQLQQQLDSNRSMFPAMMFMGIMDMMMFSSMMSFMGLAMASFIPDQYMYDSSPTDTGTDGGHDMGHDASGGDWGHTDVGHDMGGFDVNF